MIFDICKKKLKTIPKINTFSIFNSESFYSSPNLSGLIFLQKYSNQLAMRPDLIFTLEIYYDKWMSECKADLSMDVG